MARMMTGVALDWRREFNRFWVSQSASQIVTQAITVTVPLLAITYLETPSDQVGFLSALQYAPVLVITPLLGAYIDGVRRRPLMVGAHLGRSLVFIVATAIFAVGAMSTTTLMMLVLCAGLFTAAFDVAIQTFVPNTVPRDGLTWANARIQGSLSFAQVLGPLLGAGLIAIGTPWPTTALFAAGFLFAAMLLLRNRAVEIVQPRQALPFVSRLTEGVRIAFRSRVLRTLLMSSTWFNTFEQAFMTTFLVFAVREVGLDSTDVALVLGGGAIGAVVGAAVASRMARGRRTPISRLVVYSGISAVAPMTLAWLQQNNLATVSISLAVFFFYGAGLTAYNVEAISMRQRNMPVNAQGKTGAAYRMFAYGALALGGLLSSALVGLFDLRAAMFVATGLLAAGWVVLVPIYVRGLKDAM
ncbi:MFS transporter [Microbacterium sp. NPDC090007]|uniref:MFS transporter n=1 Tax=Microbacterium sp. NPDC090007 TaxID=3364204 RepID=UPI0038007DD8